MRRKVDLAGNDFFAFRITSPTFVMILIWPKSRLPRRFSSLPTRHTSSQAIDYFRRALSVDSSFRGARVNLARELVAAKEFDEACAVLRRIPEDDSLHEDAQILISEAKCQPRNGQSGPGYSADRLLSSGKKHR